MYKNITEFINDYKSEEDIENILNYDFKNQIGELVGKANNIQNENNSLLKLKAYKWFNGFDCDCCNLTNEIYMKLWNCECIPKYSAPRYSQGKFKVNLDKLDSENLWNEQLLERDTINSFQTTYNSAIIIEAKKDKNFNLNKYINEKNKKSPNFQIRYDIKRLIKENPDIEENVNKNPLMIEFAKLTHAIGNFTMLINPNINKYKKGFNSGRYSITCDYWDLSLELMKEELLKKYDYKVFETYIDTFFLSEYVEKDSEGRYQVKPLFKNHHLNKQRITPVKKEILSSPEPQDETELNEYLENVISLIKSRGRLMLKELKVAIS